MIKRIFFVSAVIVCILLLSFAVNGVYTLLTAKPFSQESTELLRQFQNMSANEKETYLMALREKADEMTARQQFNVADALLHGEIEYTDVVKDRQEAMCWLKKSAQQGLPEAQYWLAAWSESDALTFNLGNTLERSPENAFYWYSKSAQAGYALAYGRLGRMYEYGIGVEKDIKLAKYWCRKGYIENGSLSDLEGVSRLLTKDELIIVLIERFVRVALWID